MKLGLGNEYINIDEIIYFETLGNYTYVYTEKDVLKIRKTMKDMMMIMKKYSFIQVHRSFTVALKHIKILDIDYLVLRKLETRIPVSRRRLPDVKRAFNQYRKLEFL